MRKYWQYYTYFPKIELIVLAIITYLFSYRYTQSSDERSMPLKLFLTLYPICKKTLSIHMARVLYHIII